MDFENCAPPRNRGPINGVIRYLQGLGEETCMVGIVASVTQKEGRHALAVPRPAMLRQMLPLGKLGIGNGAAAP